MRIAARIVTITVVRITKPYTEHASGVLLDQAKELRSGASGLTTVAISLSTKRLALPTV
jgi:hypothetical protein